ncbi:MULTISPECIES: hypothetical protein [Yersinia pseudotuberculosis complex]|uniref:Uncharacterized protein n=1 Tax=Yersinia pseudotuberculosis serotype O:1b (strain IP 31758) TaxID=349747 RepID=A0A0U1R106_YERP3|nr:MULTISPECIES: hypothetical protein [Yersinia pseudotuberculosis complex]ABS48840.1 conserved hypothetical protein [Yersinia pseudotuberculosis IP 31758]AJK15575.1 hypothetical protein BZ19_1814 [Yersinia pseudotuberculosis str. PA3606]MCE4111268.1 hypothetical protein [Yersinia pseudotuberculosis]MCF1162502.1 hypothetical protein [Yersinia pseudotuberculosis]RYC27407.1 hypothetical protein EU971_05320 [Yersinia pseudotuberculosis]
MKKVAIIFIVLILIVALPMIYFWPTIKVLTGGNSRYTEQDKKNYQLLTDEIIKNCPRISSNYEFGYATVDGPGIEVSAVTFHGSNDIEKIHNYLYSIGFTLDRTEDSGEYWKSERSDKTVHIGVINSPKTTIVEVMK